MLVIEHTANMEEVKLKTVLSSELHSHLCCTNTHPPTWMYTQTQAHTHAWMYTHTDVHTHMDVHAQTHTHNK